LTKLHISVGDVKILNKYGFGKEMQEPVIFALSVWEPSQRVGQNRFTLHSTVMMLKFQSGCILRWLGVPVVISRSFYTNRKSCA